jgi:hypothetical protein
MWPIILPALTLGALAGACGGEQGETGLILGSGSREGVGDPAVQRIILSVGSDLPVTEYGTREAHQRYTTREQTFQVETEAMLLDAAALDRFFSGVSDDQHLSIEAIARGEQGNAGHDVLVVVQTGVRANEWRSMPPPPSYHWRHLVRVQYQRATRVLQMTGEVCRYRDVGGRPQRRCEFASRVKRLEEPRVRLVPFPAWPSAVSGQSGTAQLRFAIGETMPGLGQDRN